jgi:3-deoxy-D-manno-octulosonic-acid transferase
LSPIYNTLLLLLLATGAPLLVLLALFSPRLRTGFSERLRPLPVGQGRCVWLHAASVGEVEAAAPLIRLLLERGHRLLATTLTPTGRDRLQALFPDLRVRLAPLDLPGLTRASVRRAGVGVLVLVETEIWPNAIWSTVSHGGSVVIVSARLSDASIRWYRRARPLFRAVLRRVASVSAQSRADADRFAELGVAADRIAIGGDLKLDRSRPPNVPVALREALGSGPFLVGGSTHPGEEAALIEAWKPLRERGLRLVLAPRHVERAAEVCAAVRERGHECELLSAGAAAAEVVVIDSIGQLSAVYSLADLVFVGGTLAPIGGHNLLEPVQAGRVVVHGPHTQNQRAQQRILEPLRVLVPVRDASALAVELARLWEDPQRNAAAAAANVALEAHRGASERAAAIVEKLLVEMEPATDA